MSGQKSNTPANLNELKIGAEVTGKVKSIELYGALIETPFDANAMLHISQLGNAEVTSAGQVMKVGDEITAYVIKLDKDAGRIALSLVKPPAVTWDTIQVGQMFTGTVTRVEKYGAFVDIGAERPGMVHVSEMTNEYVSSPSDVVKVGQEVEVRVLKINRRNRQIDLSMKAAIEQNLVLDDDDDEAPLTAMELAFRRAQQRDDAEGKGNTSREKESGADRHRQQQEDILARTLRNQQP